MLQASVLWITQGFGKKLKTFYDFWSCVTELPAKVILFSFLLIGKVPFLVSILSGGKTKAMAMVVSGGKMPLHANALPLSIINTKTRVRSVSTVPLFSPASHSPSSSLSIRFKLSPRVSRSLSVVSSVLSEDRATGVSGSGGTDAFKLTYLEVGIVFTLGGS